MSMELLTNKESDDGVIQVTAVPPPNDIYHIGSKDMDVLRLEICKTQITKEATNDCIIVMQNEVIKHKAEIMKEVAPYGIGIGFSLLVFCFFSIVLKIFRRKK